MTEIQIQNLSVTFRNHPVLKNISCKIPKGKFTGLIGPNGAGKSTLLKGFFDLVPFSGNILLNGRNLSRMNARQRAEVLSFLPQERELAWAISVKDIIRLGLHQSTRQTSQQALCEEQAMCEIMEKLEIAHLAHRQADTLSGGELARVLIARVLAQSTDTIIADEPLAGLDPQHQIKIMKLFKSLTLDRRSIIASIHDLSLAAFWCDHIIMLSEGEIVAEGLPRDVLTKERIGEIYKIDADIIEKGNRIFVMPIGLSK